MNRPPPWHAHPRGRAVIEAGILRAAERFATEEEGFDPAKRAAVEAFRARVSARRLELQARGQKHDVGAAVASLVPARAIADSFAEDPNGRLDAGLIAEAILASGTITNRSKPC